jgi:predicted kinase
MRAASAPDGRARTCLLTTCGLPGAGKSTLARAVAKRAEGDGTRVTLVSFDEVERRLLSAKSKANGETPPPQVGFDAYVWKAARVEALGTVRTLLTDNRERHETTEEDVPKPTREEDDPGNTKCPYAGTHLVIADDNFYYAGMRRRCHRAAVAVGAAHVTLYVATSVANAHARNELRTPDEVVPIHALNRMADAFEAPVETRTEEKEYEENSRPFLKKGKEKETEPEKTTRPNGVNVFERGTVVCVSAADMASFRDEEDKWHVDVGKVWERIQKKWVGPATLAGASENVRVVFPKSQHCLPIVRP